MKSSEWRRAGEKVIGAAAGCTGCFIFIVMMKKQT